jgi:hypothetical protein
MTPKRLTCSELGSPAPNQPLHLTGAAILVLRGITVLQAAPAGELNR